MRFGILQRYIMGQVLASFLMALTAISAIFTLFVIMAEAMRQGLGPKEIVGILPFVVPGSLPYTIPVSLLFAVTVVYGRLAADNEIIAMKSAGLGGLTVLKPALGLGLILSAVLFLLSSEVIPRASNALRQMIFGSVEESLYRFLKKDGEINNPHMPFFIQVRDVQGKVLIDPIFRHRAKSPPAPPNTYDLTIRASKARIAFDLKSPQPQVTVALENAEVSGTSDQPFLFWINGRRMLRYPIPKPPAALEKRVMEMTDGELTAQQLEVLDLIRRERKRQAAMMALAIAAGRIDQVDWPQVRVAFVDFNYWTRKVHEIDTEKNLRVALASSAFFFVLLGAPVGILFAKRDFLSAFITCFVPIIVAYYPLVLATMNMGKEGIAPALAVFAGDAVLGVLAGFFACRRCTSIKGTRRWAFSTASATGPSSKRT